MADDLTGLARRQLWYKQSLYGQKAGWLRFLRDWLGGEIFIREVMFGHRRITESTLQIHDQMLYFLSPNQKPVDAFVSVYAFAEKERGPKRELPKYDTAIVDRLLFDFDCEKIFHSKDDAGQKKAHEWVEGIVSSQVDNRPEGGWLARVPLENAYDDALECVSRVKVDGFKPRVVFTAGKGFQVHAIAKGLLDIKELRPLQKEYAKDLHTADESVFADPSRVCRMPGTLHARTGRLAHIVEPSINTGYPTLEAILKRSEGVTGW